MPVPSAGLGGRHKALAGRPPLDGIVIGQGGRHGDASYSAAVGGLHSDTAGGMGCGRSHPGAERALGNAAAG